MGRLAVSCGLLLILAAGRLAAQSPTAGGIGGVAPPTTSPYLNLNRRGTPAGINFYGIVRPQQEFRQSIIGLEGSTAANQQAIGSFQSDAGELPATGYAVGFLNYRSRFMTLRSGSSAGGGGSRPATYGSPPMPVAVGVGARGGRR